MEKESSIKELINNSLEQVRTIIDADTVVGKQIVTNSGTIIIPISKVSMGFASGGLDLPAETRNDPKSFGGGGGTGVTVSPIGFLTIYSDGKVEMLPINQEKAGPIEQIADILDHTPDILNRIKNVFTSYSGEEPVESAAAKELEDAYVRKLEEEMAQEEEVLSKKELKKRQKMEAKAAKKAEKF